MITLILDPNGNAFEKTFDCREYKEIIIGCEESQTAHFKVVDGAIKSEHLKILLENERATLINEANDPFATLNQLPFGRKTLKDGDLLKIGHQTIRCKWQPIEIPLQELSSNLKANAEEPLLQDSIQDGLDSNEKAISGKTPIPVECKLPENQENAPVLSIERAPLLENKTKPAPQLEDHRVDQNEAKHSAPNLENEKKAQERPKKPIPAQTTVTEPARKTKSKKAENSKDHYPRSKKSLSFPQLKKLIKICTGAIILGAIACSILYFRENSVSSQEEKKIAASMADIAMALTQAQRGHILPNKQNWIDPDFIRSNLACVLSPNLHSQVHINNQGQFTHYPYILRIYTNSEMTRFLAIAQPSPNFSQWLVNKKSIVIDSETMEIRKISDLKRLNRLLTNSNLLDEQNEREIKRIVAEGMLIPPETLSGNKNHWGFAPPKSLHFLAPGAENYIYNSPRYYPFGESILQNAIAFFRNDPAASDISSIQEEIQELKHFPKLIFYTSKGLQAAMKAQQALTAIIPNHKFLVGYVKFNEEGYVESSHIFMNEETKLQAQEQSDPKEELLSFSSPFDNFDLMPKKETPEASFYFPKEIDRAHPLHYLEHPLYLRLQVMSSSRSNALAPIGMEMISLIQKQNREMIPDFYDQMSELLEKYEQEDKDSYTRMIQEITDLYQEYSEIPIGTLMQFVEAADLSAFVDDILNRLGIPIEKQATIEASFEDKVALIDQAQSLEELDEYVQEASLLLHLERLPEPSRLILLQKKLGDATIQRIAHLILSPQSPLIALKISDSGLVSKILKAAWITDPDEVLYFSSECQTKS